MGEICDDYKSRNQAPSGALMPAKQGAILENPHLQLEKQP